MNDKIIFLDFDGVLCIWGPGQSITKENEKFNVETGTALEGVDRHGRKRLMCGFRPEPVENLKLILKETKADIIVSSTWREYFNLDELSMHLKKYDIKAPIGLTTLYGWSRGIQVERWIDENEFIGNYVILDDIHEFSFEQEKHLVLTNPEFGISKKGAEKAIKILNNGI